jgi:hypothetical protein
MVEVTLHYLKRAVTRNIPENWNELNAEQFAYVVKAMTSIESIEERKLAIATALFHFDFTKINYAPEVIAEHILPFTEWVTVEVCTICKQLFPELKLPDVSLYGPVEHLYNIAFAEFDFAERKLYEWHQNLENFKPLYEFIAIMYRPSKTNYNTALNPDGDIRIPFNSNTIEHYAQLIAKHIPVHVCIAISLWYKACRTYITDCFPLVFNTDEVNQSTTPESPAYFGLMRAIAKQGTFGNFETVEKMSLYTALLDFEMAIQDHNARKKEEEDE